MESIFKNKTLLIVIVVLVVGLLSYRLIGLDDSTAQNPSALSSGQDLIRISDQLSKAQLEQDLFSIPSYQYLTDFTAPLPSAALGRTNPFGIIGER